MDLIFCGTPQFAVPALNQLVAAGHRIRLVVSQPDRPSGRGQQISLSAVKQRAQELELPVTQPERIKNNPEFRKQLESLTPQAIIVVAYGRLIPPWMLVLPPHGNLNLHASLLPKYRGAAPIQWAIARGESVTGVTTIRMDEGLDTGDILLQQTILIRPEDTALTLSPRLAEAGAALMVETLRRLEAGALQPRPQNQAQATLAPLLKKEDGQIDFSLPAETIVNRLRGFQPWPGAHTRFRSKNLQVLAARAAADVKLAISPQEILVHEHRLVAGCAENSVLEISELQLEGKKRMSAAEFINGYRPTPGDKFAS